MRCKPWLMALAVLGGLTVSANLALAGGTLRVLTDEVPAVQAGGIKASAATTNLLLTPETEAATVQTHGWRRFSYYRPYYGYGYGHSYRPWYGYYNNYYRPYYNYYYRPYYSSYYFSFGYPRYYYYPPTYYYYPRPYYYYYHYLPINLELNGSAEASPAIVRVQPTQVYGQPSAGISSTPVQPSQSTYPYNGGPANPVPMPKTGTQPRPTNPTVPAPTPTVPLEGIPVSLPAPAAPRYVYPAYGERPAPTNFATDRTASNKR